MECLRLHIKVLTQPNISINTMLTAMRQVYEPAGIRVIDASTENLDLPELTDLDVGECILGVTTVEQKQLFNNRNSAGVNDVVVYFVRSTIPAFNGCAAHPNGKPGAVVTMFASKWTLAHEVGHVLGLNHIAGEHQGCPAFMPQCCSAPNFTRLMTGCGTTNIVGTPTINQNEINTMVSSNLTSPC